MIDEPIRQQPSVSATGLDRALPPPTTGMERRTPGTLGRSASVATPFIGLASPSQEEIQTRADVQQMMQRLKHVLPFLVLFALRYVYRHAVGIAFFMAYTLVIIQLNRWGSAQVALKGDQNQKVLWLVVAVSGMSIFSFSLLRASIGGYEEVSMFLVFYLPSKSPTLEEVLWAILATDLCVRLFTLGLKALVALHSPCRPLRMSTHWLLLSFNSKGSKACHRHHTHDCRSTDEAGYLLHLDPSRSYLPSFSSSMTASEAGTATNRGTCAETIPAIQTIPTTASAHPDDSTPTRTTSLYLRKRRVYFLLEALSLLVRSLLPVPAWLRYYGADVNNGDLFVLLYVTLKCMVLTRHTRSVVNILASLLQSHILEYGRSATKEECQEAGANECVVCYENLIPEHSVALPCGHFFCESCLSEWCERERSCPLCRSAVHANFDDGGLSYSSGTPVWPCFL